MDIQTWLFNNFSDQIPSRDTEVRVNCPFCGVRVGIEDTSQHLYVSLIKPACHCFRCGYGASWTQLMKDHTGMSYREALNELNMRITPLYLLRRMQVKERPGVPEMSRKFATVNDALANSGLAARSALMAKLYVERRLEGRCDWGVYLDQWGVWTSADGFGKLVMPVEDGWWQYRNLSNVKPKYVSSPRPKQARLYNFPALQRDSVLITEGILSAAALGNDAVALCGKTATKDQLERLCDAPVSEYTVALDSDAKRESLALAETLSRAGKKVNVRLYKTGDPASSAAFSTHQYNFKTLVELALTQ